MNLYIINMSNRGSEYGIGTYIDELVTLLPKYGIYIYYVRINCGKEFAIEKKEGMSEWHIPLHESNNYYHYEHIIELFEQHISNKNKLVFHFNYYNQGFAEALKKQFACKIIFTIHFFKWGFSLKGNLSQFRTILSKPYETLGKQEQDIVNSFNEDKAFFQIVDNIICLARYTQDIIINDYCIDKGQTVVIYNGAEDKKPKQTVRRKMELRKKFMLMPDENIIIFAVGSMT